MAEQHGVLEKFGSVLKPREGKRLGVLSTGFAQEFDGAPGALFGGDASGKDWFSSQDEPGQRHRASRLPEGRRQLPASRPT